MKSSLPASLERRGSVGTFWTDRCFRIYPLCAVVVAGLLLADHLGLAEIREFHGQSLASVALAHVTLFQELLGTPNLLLVLWTLSYEMAFYLLLVGLFTVRQHRRSGAVAVTLAGLAALSVAAGFALPASALSEEFGTGRLIALAAVVMAVAICCASTGSAVLRVFGGPAGRGPRADPGRPQRHGPGVGGAGDPSRDVPRYGRVPSQQRREELHAASRPVRYRSGFSSSRS
ncbi:acyltransferase family protein [Streptomyces ossamyceticus]|uniref:acyltransferase family protein n=1 Tax=Streptomyces ossamyceticus TaxID=249581 RepID=UPI0006E1F86B